MFWNRCFDIFTEPHRNLVFQDMKALGYVTADRVIGLDEQHFEVALKKVAKFHAASIQLLREVNKLIYAATTFFKTFPDVGLSNRTTL